MKVENQEDPVVRSWDLPSYLPPHDGGLFRQKQANLISPTLL